MLGRVLGHYRIESKLGEGGMGTVYKAHDTHLDRPVAIKVLVAEAVSDPERKRRFVQEAKTASALNHPNIIHIYDIDQADGVDFIAMEYVSGRTLEQHIGPHGLTLAEVLKYGVQVADALATAHGAGIVHRDIKPANFMVTEEGLVKVLDFGLAKLTERAEEQVAESALTRSVPFLSSPRTEDGTILGTIAYMSPEQAEGKKVDTRSDIFSFGSVLYEMVTGRRPFQGKSKLATLSAILSQEPKPLSDMVKAPPEFEQIINRCLRKEPDRRFQHMSDLKVVLAELQDGSRAATRGVSLRRPAARTWWKAVAVAVLVAALVLTVRQALTLRHLPADSMIGVLALQNPRADPAEQAFSNGLVEAVTRKLNLLEQFQPNTRLISPSALRGEAGRGPSEARRASGISLALTASARSAAGKLRFAAVLVDARTLRELRRLEVELPAGDAAARQEGLVRNVARLLEFDLPPPAQRILAAGNTAVLEASDSCFQARGYLQHSDRAEDVDRAISLFQAAIEKDPSYGLAISGLGEAYAAKSTLTKDQQWVERARQAFLRAIAAQDELAEAHLSLGKIYAGAGRFQEAVGELQRALELDPLSVEAHIRLGAAYEGLGRLANAEATYRRSIELRPRYHGFYAYLASFYVRQGRYADAEPVFRKSIDLVPEDNVGYRNLGAVYFYLGRSEEAAAMMKKSLALQPTASAYTNLGTLYFFHGRYSDAVPLMERAVEMSPNSSLYQGNLADAYRWAPGHAANAAKTYRQAIQLAEQQLVLNSNDADLRATVAVYYAKLPDRERSLAEIARARRLAPMQPKVLFKSALVYELTGKRDSAMNALDLALQAGYSISEVRTEPELAELRKDARYERLEQAVSRRGK